MNAGAIPITGIDVSLVNHLDLLTRPTWVCTTGGGFIKQRQGAVNEDGVGESFMCNTFGHYVMVNMMVSWNRPLSHIIFKCASPLHPLIS